MNPSDLVCIDHDRHGAKGKRTWAAQDEVRRCNECALMHRLYHDGWLERHGLGTKSGRTPAQKHRARALVDALRRLDADTVAGICEQILAAHHADITERPERQNRSVA